MERVFGVTVYALAERFRGWRLKATCLPDVTYVTLWELLNSGSTMGVTRPPMFFMASMPMQVGQTV